MNSCTVLNGHMVKMDPFEVAKQCAISGNKLCAWGWNVECGGRPSREGDTLSKPMGKSNTQWNMKKTPVPIKPQITRHACLRDAVRVYLMYCISEGVYTLPFYLTDFIFLQRNTHTRKHDGPHGESRSIFVRVAEHLLVFNQECIVSRGLVGSKRPTVRKRENRGSQPALFTMLNLVKGITFFVLGFLLQNTKNIFKKCW